MGCHDNRVRFLSSNLPLSTTYPPYRALRALISDDSIPALLILSSMYACAFFFLLVSLPVSSEGGFFKARLTFPPEFPLLPPKMRFITPMWHPNSAFPFHHAILFSLYQTPRRVVYPDGVVCISILVSTLNVFLSNAASSIFHTIHHSMPPVTISMGMRTRENDGCPCTPSSQSSVSSRIVNLT
jgi:Ubiquitin-conjugating enzyme